MSIEALDAEHDVLSACLIGDVLLAKRIFDELQTDDFGNTWNRAIAESIERILMAGAIPTTVTVAEDIRSRRRDAFAEELPAYVRDVRERFVVSASSLASIQVVKRASLARAVQRSAQAACAAIEEGEAPGMVLSRALNEMKDLAAGQSSGGKDMADVAAESVVRAEAAGRGERRGLCFGWPDLDNLTGGLEPGSLVVLAARTSVGKSALSQQLAAYVAEHVGPVLLASSEMGEEEIGAREIARRAGVDSRALRNGALNPRQWEGVRAVADGMRGLEWRFRRVHRTDEVCAEARRYAQDCGRISLVVSDHLQELWQHDRREKGEAERFVVARSVQEHKDLARDLHCVVLLVSQLNRQADDTEPSLSDLKESGAIEEKADVVALMWPAPAAQQSIGHGALEVIVAKNRNGRRAALWVDHRRAEGGEMVYRGCRQESSARPAPRRRTSWAGSTEAGA